jgi:DNA-binding transcriptional LysR family regulator
MEFNLRGVDLNLLPIFEAAYEERGLSRAAERLAMTQPAMSHALTRLRHVFHDDLFVRRGRGVVPTPVADALYQRLRGALDTVRESVRGARGFDAASSVRRFSVAIPHPLGPLIARRLLDRLARLAPKVSMDFNTRSLPIELYRQLRDGTVDAVIDWIERSDSQLGMQRLFDDRLVAMAHRRHALSGRALTVRSLHDCEIVSLRARHQDELRPPGIREWGQRIGRPVLEVSELLEVLLVVSESSMVGLFPESFTKLARRHFDVHPLDVRPAAAPVPVHLVWHTRRDGDPGHLFLRQQLAEATWRVMGLRPPVASAAQA